MARKPQKSQHKRSSNQKAQTTWMRSLHRPHPSQNEVETFQSQNPSFDVDSKRKLIREVAEEKRKRLNSERREKRAKEKVKKLKGEAEELKGKVKKLEKAASVKSDEDVALCGRVEDLEGWNTELTAIQNMRGLPIRL